MTTLRHSKQSFYTARSQAELGNEGRAPVHGLTRPMNQDRMSVVGRCPQQPLFLGNDVQLIPTRSKGLVRAGGVALLVLIAVAVLCLRIGEETLRETEGGRRAEKERGRQRAGEPAAAAVPEAPVVDAIAEAEAPAVAMSADGQIEAITRALESRNPGFDGNTLKYTVDEGAVVAVELSADTVSDIAPLGLLRELTRLTCRGSRDSGRLADLSPLRGLSLTYLDCSDTLVSDLSPLAGMPLEELRISGTQVAKITPLRRMPLKELYCARTPVFDLFTATGLPLQVLDCQHTRIDDLSPLERRPLRVLRCGHTQVANLWPLKGLKLRELELAATPVIDLTPLVGMPLEHLDVRFTRVDNLVSLTKMPLLTLKCGASRVRDLSPLAGMRLVSLDCSNTKVVNLAPLSNLPLESLDCSDSDVTDLWPLQQVALKNLRCDFDPERDAVILRGITTLEWINGMGVEEFLEGN